jgi:hypothetical protein
MVAVRERAQRVILWLLAASSVVVGAWAQFAPRSFYDDFPGGGRQWVSPDGPYNEHLVRDVGGLNLALAVVLAVAAATLAPFVVRAAAVAALVYSAPHFVYHVAHLDLYEDIDKLGNAVSLGAAVVLPLVVLALSGARRAMTAPPP